MSLQPTANHLAAQGRYGDSMMLHVSPNEVAGLQALAQQHGRSMTINPQTGMPEAFSLQDLLPAAAGFALDYFLPGAGQAVGSMFGLGSAAGTAGIIGGIAGLSSGSLEKGILAGLGAYGGASLSSGLSNAGATALTTQGYGAAQAAAEAAGFAPGTEAYNSFIQNQMASGSAAMTSAARNSAGLSAAAANPVDFLKNNKFGVAAAALPSLMNMGSQGSTPGATRHPGYIRKYAHNPVTGALEQESATPADQFGDRSAISFGGVGRPVMYSGGGDVDTGYSDGDITPQVIVYGPDGTMYSTPREAMAAGVYNYTMQPPAKDVWVSPVTPGYPGQPPAAGANPEPYKGTRLVYNPTTKKYDEMDASGKPVGPISFGGVGKSTIVRDPNDTRTDSQKAYDYMMGVPGAKNPMLFNYQQPNTGTGPLVPTDLNTRTGGHYVLNAAGTGYDWVPDADLGTGAGAGINAGGQGGEGGQDFGGGSRADLGNWDTSGRSITGGLIPGMFQGQVPAPVSDMSTYSDAAVRETAREAASQTAREASMSSAPAVSDTGPNAMDAPGPAEGGPAGGGVDGTGGGVEGNGSQFAQGGIASLAQGGLGSLGGYSDGGRLLRGPGDGVSDSIPATIGRGRQPARLADGEFVIPARIVSELGNGSTAAGAKQLYAMMARIQAGRKKSIGKNNVAKNSRAARHLPA